MTGARVLIIAIRAATGTCYAALAGLSISVTAVPVRRFHATSIGLAVVTVCLGLLAFRAALAVFTEEDTDESLVLLLRNGMVGAFLGLVVIAAALLMFGADARSILAHALGQRTSSFTPFRLLVAAVLLGFGTGFILRVGGPRQRSRKAS